MSQVLLLKIRNDNSKQKLMIEVYDLEWELADINVFEIIKIKKAVDKETGAETIIWLNDDRIFISKEHIKTIKTKMLKALMEYNKS